MVLILQSRLYNTTFAAFWYQKTCVRGLFPLFLILQGSFCYPPHSPVSTLHTFLCLVHHLDIFVFLYGTWWLGESALVPLSCGLWPSPVEGSDSQFLCHIFPHCSCARSIWLPLAKTRALLPPAPPGLGGGKDGAQSRAAPLIPPLTGCPCHCSELSIRSPEAELSCACVCTASWSECVCQLESDLWVAPLLLYWLRCIWGRLD